MNPDKLITKFVAFLFLLMLGQKVGVGLFLHNLLHASEYKESAATGSDDKAISYACNCIEDFSMPIVEEKSIVLSAINIYPDVFVSIYHQFVPTAFFLFSSLRAPPVSVA